MSQEQPTPQYPYSVKLSTDQKCVKIDLHYYHALNDDVQWDIANQITVDAYKDLKARLEKEGFVVAPLPEKL